MGDRHSEGIVRYRPTPKFSGQGGENLPLLDESRLSRHELARARTFPKDGSWLYAGLRLVVTCSDPEVELEVEAFSGW